MAAGVRTSNDALIGRLKARARHLQGEERRGWAKALDTVAAEHGHRNWPSLHRFLKDGNRLDAGPLAERRGPASRT